MKTKTRALALWLPVTLTGLMGGCSTGARVTTVRALAPLPVAGPNLLLTTDPNPRTSVAQAAGSCWNSISCCIQKYPFTFVQNCGADPLEAARILSVLEQFSGDVRTETATMATQDGTEAADGAKADDFANNAQLPEWKQECIRNYVACQAEPNWQGPCYPCLRRCEGQQDWPFGMCWPPGKKGQ